MKRATIALLVGIFVMIVNPCWVEAWRKGAYQKPINVYAAGTIHFYGQAYKVDVEDYGRGHIIVVLHPQNGSEEEKRELYLADWRSFVDEINRINMTVSEVSQLGEKLKQILSVKELLELKDSIGSQNVRVRGVTKDVRFEKGIIFTYTVFLLTDKEGSYFRVSYGYKKDVPEGKEVIVEGHLESGLKGEEFMADRIVW